MNKTNPDYVLDGISEERLRSTTSKPEGIMTDIEWLDARDRLSTLAGGTDEDRVHTALTKLAVKPGPLTDKSLRRTLDTEMRTERRRKSRVSVCDPSDLESHPQGDDPSALVEGLDALEWRLRRLSLGDRQLMEARYGPDGSGGASVTDLAKNGWGSVSTIRRRLEAIVDMLCRMG